MRQLSFIIVFILSFIQGLAQDGTHGYGFDMECSKCHTTSGWNLLKDSLLFNHDTDTEFELIGEHTNSDCKSCHTDLKFPNTPNQCISCHSDMHQNTLGTDCDRCHTPKSWIIENAVELHFETRFPLLGAHLITDCKSCHTNILTLQFEPLGIDCFDCHDNDYYASTEPNHQELGYSKTCTDCHSSRAIGWGADDFEHSFFPLLAGHSISCTDCHLDGSYQKVSTECFTCHEEDYNNTSRLNHSVLSLSQNCEECHTTQADWQPASYKEHDAQFFPVYSGKHNNEWNTCSDCHTQSNNFSLFSCIDCHEHGRLSTNSEHDEVQGYEYNSLACFGCHPTGDEDGIFEHSLTDFPLTGKHMNASCLDCHITSYNGTSAQCNSCHKKEFDESTKPDHLRAGIPTDCETCHNTNAWEPSDFDHTTTGFILDGGHSRVPQCALCHIGTLENAQSTCISCHQVQYNEAPEHLNLGYPLDCTICHSNENWLESTFDHNNTDFPLTGQHISAQCTDCHSNGFTGTPNQCNDCHNSNYTEAQDPNHTSAGIPTDCETCHNTSAWAPSDFDHTTTGFILDGGHSRVPQCAQCHIGTLENAQSTCFSCHENDYNNTTNPAHLAAQFPKECQDCHSTNAWQPSTFDHDGQYFPIYSGEHQDEWNSCTDCHTVATNFTVFSCIDCHEHNQTDMDDEHKDVTDYVYNSLDCLSCHPDGKGD